MDAAKGVTKRPVGETRWINAKAQRRKEEEGKRVDRSEFKP